MTPIALHGSAAAGILLPQSLLATDAFSVLATFVAVNTLLYGSLALAKVLPRLAFLRRALRSQRRYVRRETRSIYPDGPV